jgi:hypothetical protein
MAVRRRSHKCKHSTCALNIYIFYCIDALHIGIKMESALLSTAGACEGGARQDR